MLHFSVCRRGAQYRRFISAIEGNLGEENEGIGRGENKLARSKKRRLHEGVTRVGAAVG